MRPRTKFEKGRWILIDGIVRWILKDGIVRWILIDGIVRWLWACGVVVSMFDFHRSDRGSNPGRGGEFS